MNIVCAGEVMVEMAPADSAGCYRRGFAGDSFNTAIYLARAGLATRYLSQLGDDAASTDILRFMEAEGLDTSLLTTVAGRCAGLYLIDNDEYGERHFTYYRDQSPARETFASPPTFAADAFYLTGITLAVCRNDHDTLLDLLRNLRSRGCSIVFDPNFRPALWDSLELAQRNYRDILACCDTVLPTLDDDRLLWNATDEQTSIDIYREYGATEIIVKGDALTATAWHEGNITRRRADAVSPVDTTGAGDAFNAGYLATRLPGGSPEESLCAAQSLAAQVVQHRGAILPRSPASEQGSD